MLFMLFMQFIRLIVSPHMMDGLGFPVNHSSASFILKTVFKKFGMQVKRENSA
jgi:hypothetical protein